MCGIAGAMGAFERETGNALVERMTASLHHRGPDAGGVLTCAPQGELLTILGHRRLSILDLTPSGAQPMVSCSGRFTITFNGEIYNHLSLRKNLGSHSFRGTSDTETLLAGFERWGFVETLKKSSGMFALAVWDSQEKKLLLARDRLGEKPLYYGFVGSDFLFASELKALRLHPGISRGLNRNALGLFLQLGYIPSPLSILEEVKKLPPGHWMELRPGASIAKPQPYWCLSEVARRGLANPVKSSEAPELVEAKLREVLLEQCVADVPLGCFLSGGIDSSLISAFLAKELPSKLLTFSIGFGEDGFDETTFARAIAEKLGTQHTELQATAADALALVPELPQIYDEPFADVSQIPALLLAKLARKHVTVALSGDGGDEVFAGYNRYLYLEKARTMPASTGVLLRAASGLASSAPFRSLESTLRLPQLDEKLRKLASVAGRTETEGYWALASQGLMAPEAYQPVEAAANGLEGIPALQLRDQLLYLPDDILVKVDRAAMHSSLETRAPFLDHRLVELAWRLPLEWRVGQGKGKLILRRLLADRLDPALWSRPKAGFTPPLGAWLKGPLREWAEELLSESSLKKTELPGAAAVRSEWLKLRDKNSNSSLRLWPALMAQAWLRRDS